jgi:hypothetical protein
MELIDIAREFLQLVSGELDPYTSTKGVIKKESENKIVLFTPSHIQFARYGRGPGKRPPLDPILKWVKEKGIIFDGTDQRGSAFAIMNSIGEKGTSNYVSGAPNALEEAIEKYTEEYNKKLNNAFAVQTDKIIQQMYGKMFSAGGNFKKIKT